MSLAVFFLLCSSAALVSAALPSLTSGYAVDSNFHGVDVPIGTQVTVTAYTTDPTVTQVTFLWKNPAGNLVKTDTEPVTADGTFNGMTVFVAVSKFAPDEIGDWGVQGLFQGPDGKTVQSIDNVVAIRATSFNVIPEVPVIGAIGASVAMIAGFTYKLKKKN